MLLPSISSLLSLKAGDQMEQTMEIDDFIRSEPQQQAADLPSTSANKRGANVFTVHSLLTDNLRPRNIWRLRK